jgi:hypothetical protein
VALKRVAPILFLAALANGCHRAPPKPERTAPWLATASPSSSTARASVRRLHYKLGHAEMAFELPAKRATPRGKLAQPRADLDVDLDDLSHTTGSISLDLANLTLTGADGTTDDAATTRALEWLELGRAVAAEKRDLDRNATFAISELDAGHVVTAPNGDRRVARRELESHWTVRGELSLHGVRAPLTADVSLTLVPGTDSGGPPAELLIRSRKPLVVPLSTHDIGPRDASGVTIAKDLPLIGDKVGSEAKVTFDLVFVPG